MLKRLIKSTILACALIIGQGLPSARADNGRMYDICHSAVAANTIAQDLWLTELGDPDEHLVGLENTRTLKADGLCIVAELKVPKNYVALYRHNYDDGIGIIVIPVVHEGMDMFAVVDELIESEGTSETVQAKSE